MAGAATGCKPAQWWRAGALSLFSKGGAGGPLLSALTSGAGGLIGANASNDAARLQSNALNRGIDLQTAQWLQQQQNQAPWLKAGQEALPQLSQLANQQPPEAFQGPPVDQWRRAMPCRRSRRRWGPQAYQGPQNVNAQDYTYTPGQGPSAANYQYKPGRSRARRPIAGRRARGHRPPTTATRQGRRRMRHSTRVGPPQLYQGAMPGTQVSQLTGQQVLDQDPGAAFRQSEARKALEGSAAAKGGLLSGSTLGALQRQSQDLASARNTATPSTG